MNTAKAVLTQEQNVLFPVHKTESAQIEIKGGSTKNQFYFPTMPLLQNAHLLNLEVDNVTTTPKAPDGSAVIPETLMASAFITLINYNGKQIVHLLPLTKLIYATASVNGYAVLLKQFKGQRIDWQKSYIQFADNALIPLNDSVALFTVYYADVKSVEAKDSKANFHNQG